MAISPETTLAIIGVIITITIGVIGIKYTLKYRRHTDIIFFKNSCIPLFTTIVKNIDDISISYKNENVGENIILFKGTFLNNGNVDIDKAITHTPLEIILPNGYSWITSNLSEASEGLNIKLYQNDRKLKFNWDLFKEGEFVTFDSLIEYNPPSNKTAPETEIRKELLDNISFNHRITNLKKVNYEKHINKPETAKEAITQAATTLLFASFFLFLAAKQYIFPEYELFFKATVNANIQNIKLTPTSNTHINIYNDNNKKIKTVTANNLNQLSIHDPNIEKTPANTFQSIFGSILLTFSIIYFYIITSTSLKERRIYKKLTNTINDDTLHREEP